MGVSKLRVGMGQILVEGGNVPANLVRAKDAIREGARQHCDIVVLPECLELGLDFPGRAGDVPARSRRSQ